MNLIKLYQGVKRRRRLNCIVMDFNLAVSSIVISFILNIFQKFIPFLFTQVDLLPWLCIAMLCDLVSGIWKAFKEGGFIVSRGLRKTVDKVIQYFCFLIVCQILSQADLIYQNEKYLDWLPKACIVYLILIELKSILENISDNKQLPTSRFIKYINQLLGKFKWTKDNTTTNKIDKL